MTTATPIMSRSPGHLAEEPDVTADAGPVARSASDVARDAAFERDALPWLDDVYRFAVEQSSISRGQFLELTVVLILVLELVLVFMGVMK